VGNDIEATLLLLAHEKVRFLVVGGVAVVLHGYLRLTADLDIVLDLDAGNVARAVRILEREGFQPRAPVALSQFADREIRQHWAQEKNMQVLSLWSPSRAGFELDIFVEEPFAFEQVWTRALTISIEDHAIGLISLPDLIDMKRAAGRPRDLEDVQALQKLMSERSDDES